MEKEIKTYVVGGANHYATWINNCKIVNKLEDADVVLFTGGEDVDPSIYGCEKHPRTFSNIQRDKIELEIFNKIKPTQLALGICRGSQFLCAVNGGLLIQDCNNHALGHTHQITDGSRVVDITSTHHQMQYPFVLLNSEYDLLYWANPSRSRTYLGDKIEAPYVEPEIVYYHVKGKPKSLAIQGHPEMMRKEAPIINILNDLLKSCLDAH